MKFHGVIKYKNPNNPERPMFRGPKIKQIVFGREKWSWGGDSKIKGVENPPNRY